MLEFLLLCWERLWLDSRVRGSPFSSSLHYFPCLSTLPQLVESTMMAIVRVRAWLKEVDQLVHILQNRTCGWPLPVCILERK